MVRRTIVRWNIQATALRTLLLGCWLMVGLGGFVMDSAAQDEGETFKTTLVVTTAADPMPDSITRTCGYASGIYTFDANEPCSFRRAIVEASARPTEDRPILIRFEIPETDAENFNAELGFWTISLGANLTLARENTLETLGQVTIDGGERPLPAPPDGPMPMQGGGTPPDMPPPDMPPPDMPPPEEMRGDPAIVLDTNDWVLSIESTNNVWRNFSFKGGGILQLKDDAAENTVEYNWFGLTDDGQELALADDNNPRGLAGGGGISVRGNMNIIRHNVLTGFGRAIDVSGDANMIDSNWIGTRADGTVPDVNIRIKCLRSFTFEPLNWYGGWGLRVSGDGNMITNNLIAGLHQMQSQTETPPMAIEVFGINHEISGNQIGVDTNGIFAEDGSFIAPGVCGGGIKAAGTATRIVANTLVDTKVFFPADEGRPGGAILINDGSPLFDQLTMQENVVINGPGLVVEFGPAIPMVLKTFVPPVISSITVDLAAMTTTIMGNAVLCEACRIDFYLDDFDGMPDANQESLEWLGSTEVSVPPGGNTDFTVVLNRVLPEGFGVRTNATALFSAVIGNFATGTSTKYSDDLYVIPAPIAP